MSQDNRSRAQTATRTRPQRLPGLKPEVQSPKSKAENPQSAIRNPIEGHRLIAALALVLLLALSLILTRPPSPPDLGVLVTPDIDGSGSVLSGKTSDEVARSVFRYVPVLERNQNNQILENIADVLRFDPGSVRARQVLIGQMYASTTGSLNQTLVDTGFFSQRARIDDIETAYQELMNKDEEGPKGANGLAVISLVRALNATGQERKSLERDAILRIQAAIGAQPENWQFTYNWALANMVAGNYAAAYEGMRGILARSANDNNQLAPFWMGVAALRLGDPGAAMESFTQVINAKVPEGGNQQFESLFAQAKKLANEGLADAQWANRDPASAYATYYRLLHDTGYSELYPKWVRLGIQQRAYERLVSDMQLLETEEGFRNDPRIHHDRARLLTFLGRSAEAEGEYKEAIRLGQDDAPLHISYGQALENEGDHNGALVQAETALRTLGKDPGSSDLSSVASAAALTTTSPLDRYNAQQVLDAYLLRARAWGKMGQSGNVSNLVKGITQRATGLPPLEAGLLLLYAGYADEVGRPTNGLSSVAEVSYGVAWDKLKGLPAGTPGRAAALAGLARATARGATNAALQALKDGGYDPTAPKGDIANDPDAPDILYQGGLILKQAAMADVKAADILIADSEAALALRRAATADAEAANALRVAAIADNIQNVRQVTGFGRPIWYSNATFTPSNAILQAAEASRDLGEAQRGLTILRYRQSFLLDPAQAPAWNNLGLLYAQAGRQDLADSYFSAAGTVSPDYALGRHNQASLEYQRGIGDFFNAEEAQGAAIKSVGVQSLSWGYNLRDDNRGPFPAPVAPAQDLLMRLSVFVILALLLAHTLVGNDQTAKGLGLQPTMGVLGRLAVLVDDATGRIFPALMRPGSSIRALLMAIILPSIIGMVGLAWLSGRGSLEVALVFLPVALLAALLAFGANEVAQYIAARRSKDVTTHHTWPFGALLGILSIPFGFVYGWQVVTHVQPNAVGNRVRDLDEGEGIEEDQAQEEQGQAQGPAPTPPPSPYSLTLLPMSARILLAGLVANLALGLIFGIAYWLTAWPSMRLGMFASMLVLAFTSVSEPPADGWTLYRRNPSLWLAIFVGSATIVTLLASGLI